MSDAAWPRVWGPPRPDTWKDQKRSPTGEQGKAMRMPALVLNTITESTYDSQAGLWRTPGQLVKRRRDSRAGPPLRPRRKALASNINLDPLPATPPTWLPMRSVILLRMKRITMTSIGEMSNGAMTTYLVMDSSRCCTLSGPPPPPRSSEGPRPTPPTMTAVTMTLMINEKTIALCIALSLTGIRNTSKGSVVRLLTPPSMTAVTTALMIINGERIDPCIVIGLMGIRNISKGSVTRLLTPLTMNAVTMTLMITNGKTIALYIALLVMDVRNTCNGGVMRLLTPQPRTATARTLMITNDKMIGLCIVIDFMGTRNTVARPSRRPPGVLQSNRAAGCDRRQRWQALHP